MSAPARAALGYAGAGVVLVLCLAWLAASLLGPAAAPAVWVAAALAYGVQVVSFGALVALRRGKGFFVAWGGGTLLRMGVVLGIGTWLAGSRAYAPAPLLLSLAGFLFLLLLLEPAFFRLATRAPAVPGR